MIQFGSRLPLFNGVFPTLLGPEQALVMEQEVDTLLRKEAIKVVTPRDRESGFYSVELLSHETQDQDAYCQAICVSNQVRGLVCDDRSERRLLPYIHSSSTLGLGIVWGVFDTGA